MTPRSTTRARVTTLAITAGLAFGAVACASGTARTAPDGTMSDAAPSARTTGSDAAAVLAAWPEKQRETARELMGKYGQPAVVSNDVLVWYDSGPFVRTELHRREVQHNFPMPHVDYLTQTVRHAVPANKLGELHEYDGSVWHHRTRGELSAQCDVEAMNLLALNLSHDIIIGKRTVADAREFYGRTALAFKGGDRSSPYTSGLVFQQEPNAADPDRALPM